MVVGAAAILDPDAEAHPARLMTLRRASGTLPIAEAFDDLVEPLCKVAVNAAVARSKRLAQGKQILATKIIGIDPQSPRDHAYDFAELDELVLAYATTIHKSQGS